MGVYGSRANPEKALPFILQFDKLPMQRPYILSIEDDKNDIALMQFAMSELDSTYHMEFLTDGISATAFFNSDAFKNNPPTLILLDINLPGINGLEVLKKYRGTSSQPQVPVVVMSSSDRDDEIRQSYSLGANSYIEKPRDLNDLRGKLELMTKYWMETNKL